MTIPVQRAPLSKFFDAETDNTKLIACNQSLVLCVELISTIGVLYACKLKVKKISKKG